MLVEKIKSKKDNLEIELCVIEPKTEPKAIVQFSHGMAEHKERYYDFMNYLAENGYVCVINDHRGHGASVKNKKELGYFYSEDINFIVDDLHQVTEYIKEKYPNLKIYLFSHSMGTLVARNYMKKYDADIDKVVLCGPPTENKLAGFGVFFAKVSKLFHKKVSPNKTLNKMTFGSYGKGLKGENEWICANPETVKNYNNDELCGNVFTTNGFINLYKLMKNAFTKKDWAMNNPELKIFIIAGKDDPVIQNENKFNLLISFLNQRGYKNISSKLYDNMRHEILNETDNRMVYEDVLSFYNN